MRIKHYLWILLVAGISIVLFACAKEFNGEPQKGYSNNQQSLTISEAKKFFEDHIEYKTRAHGDPEQTSSHLRSFTPGDFTPHWENASCSENIQIACVDVPIHPEYKYRALKSNFRGAQPHIYSVTISQKILIVKDKKNETLQWYVMSLIPDEDYFINHKGNLADNFMNIGDHGQYSGLVIYHQIDCQIPIRVDKYKTGVKTDGVYLHGPQTLQSRCKKMNELLSGILIQRTKIIATRSGEDDGWWDFGDGNQYWDMGNGMFTDGDNFYVDYDGDQKPDSIWIPPVDITPDPNPGGDNWNSGWETGGGNIGDGNEEENPEIEEGGGTSNNPSNPEKPNINQPADLSLYYGQKDYYQKRIDDFIARYGNNATPPSYYRDYALKYFQRFNDETYPKMSEKGKIWVKVTSILLQTKIEEILRNNQNIELDEEQFRKAAFNSHAEAYLEAGILDLQLPDKIEIFLTVDIDDLFKPEGMQQVGDVLANQIIYYIAHPNAALDDAQYIKENWPAIIKQITEYVYRQLTKTRSSISYTYDDVIELILGPQIDYFYQNIDGFELPPIIN